jgi:hypothetical protein
MLKEVFAPHLNRNVKLGGRQIPVAVGPHLRLENYMKLSSMPSPPSSLNLSTLAMACLIQIFGNNALGDCVIAGKSHVDGVWTGNGDAGTPFIATENQVVSQYSAIGGYVPGNPATDQGCNMQTALNWWTQNPGADGSKLVAWTGGSPTNVPLTMASVNLLEHAYIGMALADSWISPFPSANGFVWDVAGDPDPSNGHCVMAYGYNSQGLLIDSWGLLGVLTWGAVAKYCSTSAGGELYYMLSTDMLLKGQQAAPNGVAWGALISDWDSSFGGNVPAPTPPTPAPPAPTPAPPGSITLAQAQAAAVAKLQTVRPLLTRGLAESLVNQALAELTGWAA